MAFEVTIQTVLAIKGLAAEVAVVSDIIISMGFLVSHQTSLGREGGAAFVTSL